MSGNRCVARHLKTGLDLTFNHGVVGSNPTGLTRINQQLTAGGHSGTAEVRRPSKYLGKAPGFMRHPSPPAAPKVSQQNFNTERQATAPCRNYRGSSGVLNAQGNAGGLLRFARHPRSRRMRAEAPSRQHRGRRTTDDRERRPTAQLHCTARAGSASVATSDTPQRQLVRCPTH
jgi:hypothetical protein